MKKRLILTGLIGLGFSLMLGGGLFLLTRASQQVGAAPVGAQDGRRLVDFELPDLNGEVHSLTELSGSPAVINFWATWCAPCEMEMPLLQSYSQEYPQVKVIGVNSGESADVVGPFLEKYDITFPVWLDFDLEVTEQLRIIGLPATYFIDLNGNIQATHLGQLTPALLDQYLLRLGVEP